MTKQELEKLSKPELIDLVLAIESRLVEVEQELAELKAPKKTSKNSSKPPSSDQKGNGSRKGSKSGGKRGQKGTHFQPIPEADEQKHLALSNCPDCEQDLSEQPVLDTHIHQVIGIEIRRVVTNYVREEKYCPCCQETILRVLHEGVDKHHYDN